MRTRYKVLLLLIITEILIISFLQRMNIQIKSWFGNFLGAILFLLPIQILLFCLSRDENSSRKKRIIYKITFWYLNVCFLAGGIATLILRG